MKIGPVYLAKMRLTEPTGKRLAVCEPVTVM
jgi:hypothetical protein